MEMVSKLNEILKEMENRLEQDGLQAAEMDERGDIAQMNVYDKAVAVRKEDIALIKRVLSVS